MQTDTATRVFRNTAFLTAGDLLNKLGSVFFSAALARRLGPDGFGAFSLALVLATLASPVADLGLPSLILRDGSAAAGRAAALTGAGVALRCLLVPVAGGLIGIAFWVLGYDSGLFIPVLLIGFGVLAAGSSQIFHAQFRVSGKAHLETVSFFARLPLLAGLAVWLLTTDTGIEGVARMYLVYSLLAAGATALVACWGSVAPARPRWREAVLLVKRSIPLALQGAMVIVYQYSSSLVLSRTHGVVSVGFYQGASRLTTSLNILGKAFTTAMLPHLVRVQGLAGGALESAYYRAVKYLLALGLPIAAGTTVLAPRIIELFYGGDFGASVLPLQILIWAEVLVFWGFSAASVLLARDQRWALSVQAAAGGVFNVAASIFCVLRWGVVGAAVATLASEVLAVGLFTVFLARCGVRLPRRLTSDVATSAVACAFMVVVLRMTGGLGVLVQIPLGAAVYAVLLAVCRFLDTEEMQTARRLLGATASGT